MQCAYFFLSLFSLSLPTIAPFASFSLSKWISKYCCWSSLFGSVCLKTSMGESQPRPMGQSGPPFPSFAHELKIVFIYFNGWLQNKTKSNVLRDIKLCKMEISGSIDKVLLKHSHSHLFLYCSWLLLPWTAELSSWKRPYGPQSRKELVSGPSTVKFVEPWSSGEPVSNSRWELGSPLGSAIAVVEWGSQQASWVQILAQRLTNCGASSWLLKLSVLQLPHLHSGNYTHTHNQCC